jgi:predicted RNase H-like nuclease
LAVPAIAGEFPQESQAHKLFHDFGSGNVNALEPFFDDGNRNQRLLEKKIE